MMTQQFVGQEDGSSAVGLLTTQWDQSQLV